MSSSTPSRVREELSSFFEKLLTRKSNVPSATQADDPVDTDDVGSSVSHLGNQEFKSCVSTDRTLAAAKEESVEENGNEPDENGNQSSGVDMDVPEFKIHTPEPSAPPLLKPVSKSAGYEPNSAGERHWRPE